MATQPFPIRSQPGIQRDGTRLAGQAYSDGLWTRFQRGLPKKIGGYITLTDTLPEIVYGMDSYAQAGVNYQHHGSTSFLTQVRMNSVGNFIGQSDRTPGAGFNPNVNNVWQFGFIADPSGGNAQIVTHPGQNLAEIDNTVETNFFIGDVSDTAALVQSGLDPQSGGCVALYPYVLTYGNFGRVDISALEDLTVPPPDTVFVTGSKIVKGLSLRGGGGGPAGLLWSLDSLIRATFNPDPTAPPFSFDIITDDISVLSSRGIINDLGIYYWAGVDRFFMFNGVVREIPNDMCSNFFFDNLNFTHRQKVFSFKVPRYGEIWWCFPRGSATECNHAVVFNRNAGYWFDTPLPNSGRSDAMFAKVYNRPFMSGIDPVLATYKLWQHETGTDEINGSSVLAIRSYFETGDITLLTADEPKDASLRIERVEPDFVQTGDMSITVVGETNSKSPTITSVTKTFPVGPTTAEFQTVPLKDAVRRILRFRFESNVAGGNYEMGHCLGHMAPNDQRVTQ